MSRLGPPLHEPVDTLNLLRSGLAAKPDELALVSAERRWTWRKLEQATDRLAGNLHELGVIRYGGLE